MNRPNRPIVLGIVGDSASGKTTISRGLTKILGTERVTHICTDDYHKFDRRERAALDISALHPDCNYLDIMQLHLERMHYGQPILKPVYDHATGSLVRPEYVQPAEFVIVDGLLSFFTPVMRQFFDVKVFLAPREDLRQVWKVRRDTSKRGYTRDQVIDSLRKREFDSESFIRPQQHHADVVVSFAPPEGVNAEESDAHLDVRLVLRPTIPHPDLSYLFEDRTTGEGIRLKLGRDGGLPVDFLEIDGNVSTRQARRMEHAIWQHMPEMEPVGDSHFGDYEDARGAHHSHPLALTQLLIAYHLLRKYKDLAHLPFAAPVAALSRLQVTQEAAQELMPA
ncbi:phosphoribulokinase [Caldilinea sp.]|uniref:phosphoribulokinase n=1 Tax=Caldilinea sp. TaxID=2293560 RepID=UPI002B5A8DD1|nr:phosphoribulokinase [Anaerolineales bacterium]HQY94676.1 phosphoribulokinase [Caldilinea sp.]HRA64935.1 phosphoribulokinase [Caldilinea sp.]